MSPPEPTARSTPFTLSAPPPIRALAISSGATVLGAAVLVLSSVLGWPVGIAVAAVVVLALGVALAVAALVLTARARTVVRTDDEQITVSRAGRSTSARWASVREVSLAGQRLTLRDQQGRSVLTVLNPRPRPDPTFTALGAEIGRRLDADRGYGAPLG